MRFRRGVQIGFMAALVLASACVPAPKPPEAPAFDPKVVFRDLAKGSSRPMVVDWTPDDRASLESRASHGPILVRITEAGIEPLWDCTLPDGAKYEFTGVSPKRDHVDAHSDAELAANFPVGFAKLRAAVKSGQSISADVRLVGVAELNRLSVKRADLPPACQSATHFVKELTIGGFQFGSGATSEGGAGAGAGGLGVDANYKGVSNRITEEGDFKVCEAADPDSRTAPGRCKGILRIRLVPIGEDATQVQTTCGANMRWDGRSCIDVEAPPAKTVEAAKKPAEPPPAFECNKTNLTECLEQCKKGSGSSCTLAGKLVGARKGAKLDDLKTLFTAACNAKNWEGCSTLGDILQQAEHKDDEAAKLHGLACLNGFSGGCTNYGVAAYFGRAGVKEDRGLAFKLWDRACRLGDFVACSNAGVVVNKGEGGVKRDETAARKLFDTACKNDDPGGCTNYAWMLENGVAGATDKPGALRALSRRVREEHSDGVRLRRPRDRGEREGRQVARAAGSLSLRAVMQPQQRRRRLRVVRGEQGAILTHADGRTAPAPLVRRQHAVRARLLQRRLRLRERQARPEERHQDGRVRQARVQEPGREEGALQALQVAAARSIRKTSTPVTDT